MQRINLEKNDLLEVMVDDALALQIAISADGRWIMVNSPSHCDLGLAWDRSAERELEDLANNPGEPNQ
jgi:hypothetical protein